MDMIHEPARDVPVVADVDVCVVGGSCTGVFAAVAAARLGASVAIVECGGFFGGVATAGLVNLWHTFHDTTGERQIIGGLTEEVVERLRRRGAAVGGDPKSSHPHIRLNTEELKVELDELVTEADVRPFLHTRFTAPIGRSGHVDAVVIEDKTGRRAIRASQFVDATGDGDLIARMGLPWRKLDDLQPPTACPIIRGLGAVAAANPGFSLGGVVFDPKYANALPHGFLWSAPVVGADDLTMVAGTRVAGADCSDADALTAAEIESRRQARAICDIVREHFAEGKNVNLQGLPSYIGIRETRHADCLHQLTEKEVLGGVRFDDAIGNGTYPVDVHHSGKPGITFRNLDGTERYAVPGRPTQTGRWLPEGEPAATFYQIPFRSLVPAGSENVLAAGRLIDADRAAYGAIRVMVNCNQTGQAAGAAAVLALSTDGTVADVDVQRLRDTLTGQGAIVV